MGTVTNKYIRGINLLAAEDGAGIRKWYLYNGHGDVIQLTDAGGNVIKNYAYDAFGNEISDKIGMYEAAGKSGTSIVEVVRPDSGETSKSDKAQCGGICTCHFFPSA